MIAAQLIAAQNATMEYYRRAMIPEQRFEGRGENLNQANKLSHTSVVAARPNILREAARRCAPALPSAVRILAYRLQADRLGDLDTATRRLLDRIGSGSADEVVRRAAGLDASGAGLRPGTTADLDGVCARRRTEWQVGAKEWFLDRTKERN